MTRWLTVSIVLLVALPANAEPMHNGIELSIWLKNLEAEQPHVRRRAYESLLTMGADAKPAMPRIIAAMKRRPDGLTIEPLVGAALKIDPSTVGPLLRELIAATNRNGKIQISRDFYRTHADALLPHLTALLTDRESPVRLEAVRGLVDLGSVAKSAVPALIRAADEPLFAMRVEVAQAIELLDPSRLPDVLPALIDVMTGHGISIGKFAQLMNKHASQAIPALAARLFDRAEASKLDLALALAQFDRPGLSPLIQGMLHEDPAVRRACANALRDAGSRARDALLLLHLGLDDEHPSVRIQCAAAVLAIGSNQESLVLPTLIDLLAGGDFNVMLDAVQRLGDMKETASPAVPALLQLLDTRDRTLRLKAVWALLRIDPKLAPDAVAALVRSFKEGGDWGRRSSDLRLATTLVGEMGATALPVLPLLVKQFAHENVQLRMACVAAALRVSPVAAPHAIPVLRELLPSRYGSGSAQHQAVRELGQLGAAAREALPDLLELLQNFDASTDTQNEAAVAALLIAPDESAMAVKWLRTELKDDGRADDALQAMLQLRDLAAPAVPELLVLLRSKSSETTRLAAAVIAEIGPAARSAVPALMEMARTGDESRRRQASNALARVVPAAK